MEFLAGIDGAQVSPSFAGYTVDGAHILLEETDSYDTLATPDYLGAMSGEAFSQGALTGNFSTASVAGSTYVFGAQGVDSNLKGIALLVVAGMFSLNADGTVNGVLNWGDGSSRTTQPPLPFTGTYTIDSTGRIVLSNLTDGSTSTYNMYFYVSADGSGVVFSNDASDVFQGQAYPQQSGPFSAASFSGTYPMLVSFYAGDSAFTEVGTATVSASSGTNTLAGYVDTSNGKVDQNFTGSFTPSANGVFQGTLDSLYPLPGGAAELFTLYLVDSTHGFAVETDDTGVALVEFRQ